MITTKELFDDIEINLSFSNLNGTLTFEPDTIIWKCDAEMLETRDESEDMDEIITDFPRAIQEILYDAYLDDSEIIEEMIDSIDTLSNWKIDEPETENDKISFKITSKL